VLPILEGRNRGGLRMFSHRRPCRASRRTTQVVASKAQIGRHERVSRCNHLSAEPLLKGVQQG
jgi:hypothetical protein